MKSRVLLALVFVLSAATLAQADTITYSWAIDLQATSSDIYLTPGQQGEVLVKIWVTRSIVVDPVPASHQVTVGYPSVTLAPDFDAPVQVSQSAVFTYNRSYGGWAAGVIHNQGFGAALVEPGLSDYDSVTFYVTDSGLPPIPEPASLLLLGTGLAGLARVARRRRQ